MGEGSFECNFVATFRQHTAGHDDPRFRGFRGQTDSVGVNVFCGFMNRNMRADDPSLQPTDPSACRSSYLRRTAGTTLARPLLRTKLRNEARRVSSSGSQILTLPFHQLLRFMRSLKDCSFSLPRVLPRHLLASPGNDSPGFRESRRGMLADKIFVTRRDRHFGDSVTRAGRPSAEGADRYQESSEIRASRRNNHQIRIPVSMFVGPPHRPLAPLPTRPCSGTVRRCSL